MPIPKIIHFVWAGGAKLLPKDNIATIKEWAILNPDFTIYLWIDQETAPPQEKLPKGNRLSEHYESIFSDLSNQFEIHDINEFSLFSSISTATSSNLATSSSAHTASSSATIDMKSNTEASYDEIYKIIRYEIDKLRPNYGASSDLIRYLALYKYGGAYFDSDVKPNPQGSLNGLFQSKPGITIFLDTNSQGMGIVGNDAFICTDHHTFMLKALEEVKKNYRNIFQTLHLQFQLTYLLNSAEFLQNFTIDNTGPQLILTVLGREQGNISKFTDPFSTVTYAVENQTVSVTFRQMGENKGNWLIPQLHQIEDIQLALRKLLAVIDFEINFFGILRLDDHINAFVEASNTLPTSVETRQDMIISALILELASKDLTTVKVVQVQSQFSKIQEFYEKYGLEKRNLENYNFLEFREKCIIQNIGTQIDHSLCFDQLELPSLEEDDLSGLDDFSSDDPEEYTSSDETSSNNLTLPKLGKH